MKKKKSEIVFRGRYGKNTGARTTNTDAKLDKWTMNNLKLKTMKK
jgi:hypothetical protein